MNIYISQFVIALILSFILTCLIKNYCLKKGIVVMPRRRDVHNKPMPRVGGVAIFLSYFIISILYFVVIKPETRLVDASVFGIDKHLLGIWLSGLIITFSMLIDDLRGMKAWHKLLVQIAVVLIIIASGIGINSLANPFGQVLDLNSVYIPIMKINGVVYHFSLWSDLLTLVWVVGMMNIINFVDGVDGLAGGVSFIATIAIFLLSISVAVNQPAMASLTIILAGAILGFLFWNFPPAKIFMGDSGSMFLGFMLGVLPLISGGKLATVFLVLGFPIVDGLYVVITRLLRGKNPITAPDKTHLHHRFLRAGYSPRQAVLFLYAIAVLFAWVALQSTTMMKLVASVVLVILIFLFIILLSYIEKRKLRK